MASHFSWIPFYRELADTLAKWQDRQGELIQFLINLREQNYVVSSFIDKDEDGSTFLLQEIDPFTFFGVFNRGIRFEQRVAILKAMKDFFDLQSPVPSDFDGIPILNNMSSWFIAYKEDRGVEDVKKLWRVFLLALQPNPLSNQEFIEAFDDALTVRRTNINLTIGLFWIRPEIFLNLDQRSRAYLDVKLPREGLSAKFYKETIQQVSKRGKSFNELSLDAYNATGGGGEVVSGKVDYWLVGAYWDDIDPPDQTDHFLKEGIWVNGYTDRYLDEVKSMRVDDKIAIKAYGTQKIGLPFDNRGNTVSRMEIKAIGTIVANRQDGRTVEVEWDENFVPKVWYFYTHPKTVWHVKKAAKNEWRDVADQLIQFVWYDKPQNYDWFIKRWWDSETPPPPSDGEDQGGEGKSNPLYGVENVVSSGVFLTSEEVSDILTQWREKKALIMQGPPGVGKTFVARKLAYALMKEVDQSRLEFVQFHQSYAYDDFVRGYRPLPGQAGTFGLKDGLFYTFCMKAIRDPERDYVFIIDEINRGNLSQIFGELLMLVENDKRGPEFAVPLVYQNENEPRFYIPTNLYLMGLMNVADRSLAMVDYALRRRFKFVTLTPKYESAQFTHWLADRGMKPELIHLIVDRLSALNRVIWEDPLLGENYQIGHSYFCPKGSHFETLDEKWYRGIVKTEIVPLVKEYWFDNPRKAEEAERALLA